MGAYLVVWGECFGWFEVCLAISLGGTAMEAMVPRSTAVELSLSYES